ncbi:MAG: hypothetical protein CMJ68_08210, partial [Planctomycetaceae bacterium]|nr:hypothetical protein [Planctomycetaceae bacterium]
MEPGLANQRHPVVREEGAARGISASWHAWVTWLRDKPMVVARMSLGHADPLQRNKTGEKQGPMLVGKPDTVEQGMMMRTGHFRAVIGTVLAVVALSAGSDATEKKTLFDMQEIRNPRSLAVKVLQDWHRVNGPVPTRQKLVTIRVGEIWPGRE